MFRRFAAAIIAGLAATAPTYIHAQNPNTTAVTPASFIAPVGAPSQIQQVGLFDGPHAQTLLSQPPITVPGDEAYGPSFWAHGEYLLWYTRAQGTPLLIGTVPDSQAQTGQLPLSAVTPLFPTKRTINFNVQNGFRGQVGGRLNPALGFDVGGFFLENINETTSFNSGANGSPALVRTYTRAADGSNQNLYSALPGQYPGGISVFADTQFYGGDGNLRVDWYRLLADRNELLVGFRYLGLEESLIIRDRSDLGGGVVNTVTDVFRTKNNFYGGQVGLHTRLLGTGRATIDIVNKLALGAVNQRAEIFGTNTFTGLPVQDTGLYAGTANSGVFTRTKFAAAGEFGLNFGYEVSSGIRLHAGYSIIWLSSVIRPGHAIDPTINDSQVRFVADAPPDTQNRRPTFDFGRSAKDFWVQGLNLGISLAW
ncbi:MAG: BBP7 family outer membrane beta-barrel protein [Gemmataceae bacterium]